MMSRFLILAVAVSACAGSEDPGADVGRISASLSATGAQGMGTQLGVREIIVTIDKVTAHSNTAGWVNLSSSEVRVDILKLADSAVALGFQNVPAGRVSQLRLYVKEGGEQYVTRNDGTRIDLKVPSGLQSGIKLKGLFDVDGCQASNVPLALDGKRSIWVHPTGGEDLWILRPVIRTGKIEASGMACLPPPGGGGGDIPGGGTGGGTPGGGGTGGGGGLTEGGGDPGMNPPPPAPLGGSGSICATGSTCLSGVCTNGTCGQGGPDAPCTVGADCVSGQCTAGACAPGNAVGTGAPCTFDAMCLSGACVNGQCDSGGQGRPCLSAGDCLSGYQCIAGACTPPIN